MPRFTVLMPTWQRDYLIRNAIQSILDQTFTDFELLIVDDGSEDMTYPAIKDFDDKRIRYIKLKRHQGLVPALTMGNALAEGEIIVKQDSDDVSFPNRLQVIHQNMADNDFFYHGMYQTFEEDNGVTRRIYFPALPIDEERIFKEQYLPGCFAYTKQFSKEVPYRQLFCSEDWMLILDAIYKKQKMGFVNEGLYEYFLRDDSNSLRFDGTGHYEDDEQKMKEWLAKDYGVSNFKYSPRT